MADLDIGEMFLNFVLHNRLRALCGVTTHGMEALMTSSQRSPGVWQRAVGLKPSPYQSVQGMMVAERADWGDRTVQEPFSMGRGD
jgi:hypothetical protein